MSNETKMSADEVLFVMRRMSTQASRERFHMGMEGAQSALHFTEDRDAIDFVAALIAERDELTADNKALRAAYHKARNAAAGFSNYCEESASSRRCERELAEAERMFRDIDAARRANEST